MNLLKTLALVFLVLGLFGSAPDSESGQAFSVLGGLGIWMLAGLCVYSFVQGRKARGQES